MNKVYYYLNSHPDAMGVVEILGTKYRISESTPLRHSERPEYRSWTNPQFGVWYIQPEKGKYLKVALI